MSLDSGQARQYAFGVESFVDSRVVLRRMPRTLKVSPMEMSPVTMVLCHSQRVTCRILLKKMCVYVALCGSVTCKCIYPPTLGHFIPTGVRPGDLFTATAATPNFLATLICSSSLLLYIYIYNCKYYL